MLGSLIVANWFISCPTSGYSSIDSPTRNVYIDLVLLMSKAWNLLGTPTLSNLEHAVYEIQTSFYEHRLGAPVVVAAIGQAQGAGDLPPNGVWGDHNGSARR